METKITSALKVFYCYAHEDESFRDELDKHLEALKREDQIITWHDREIQPGIKYADEIDRHLRTSDILLLLVSPDFMHSDYCYGIEMRQAMQMHRDGVARIIPIILRPADWGTTDIILFQSLPKDGKAITKWRNRDDAYLDIVNGIRKVVTHLREVKEHLRKTHELAYRLVDQKAKGIEDFLQDMGPDMLPFIDPDSLSDEAAAMFNSGLVRERKRCGWTQKYLADKLQVPLRALHVWEMGTEPSS